MECPSTVNEMTKGGGAEFKKIWENADHTKNDRTPNRMVRYFSPAFDGYVGFIDKYGMSVINEPTPQQYDYLVKNFVGIGDLTEGDVKMGAREYLVNKRAALEGVLLEEEIRMNPFDEKEMFTSGPDGFLLDTALQDKCLIALSYSNYLALKSVGIITGAETAAERAGWMKAVMFMGLGSKQGFAKLDANMQLSAENARKLTTDSTGLGNGAIGLFTAWKILKRSPDTHNFRDSSGASAYTYYTQGSKTQSG
jgi:hypothetical protein